MENSSEPVKEPVKEPLVLDWDRIEHKNVRSKDRADVGSVTEVHKNVRSKDRADEDSIVIITEGGHGKYKLPKSEVDEFDGAEVFLKSTISELQKYKVSQ